MEWTCHQFDVMVVLIERITQLNGEFIEIHNKNNKVKTFFK